MKLRPAIVAILIGGLPALAVAQDPAPVADEAPGSLEVQSDGPAQPATPAAPGTLTLGADLSGTIVIRDVAGGKVTQMDKEAGTPVGLALPAGTYEVLVRGDQPLRGTAVVTAGREVRVDAAGLVTADDADLRDDDLRFLPFNVQVVPGLAVCGLCEDVIQGFSLDLIAGRAAALDGFEIATALAWETRWAKGAQLSGGVGIVEGPMSGAQLSAGVTVAGQLTGAQAAGGVAVATGEVVGMQWAGGVAVATGPFTGIQASGGVSVATDDFTGFQTAGGVNVVAGDMTGFQLAPLNITTGRVEGVQFGVVNYAEDADAPIGILSIVKNGQHHLDIWGSDAVPVAMAARIGGRYVYNLFALGVNPVGDETKWMFGLGIGGHIPLMGETVFLDIDALGWHVNEGHDEWTTDLNVLSQLRVTAGYRFAERFAIFGGVTANVLTSRVSDGSDWRLGSVLSETHDDIRIEAWPGFLLGLRI
jgi:hypothetical protein